MTNQIPKPISFERPSDYSDRLGVSYSSLVSSSHKKELGQFFTPVPIADLLASLSSLKRSAYKILDPGCGTAILTCALVERLVATNKYLNSIDVVAYESDLDLVPFTKSALNYLKLWLKNKDISFRYTLHSTDFVIDYGYILSNDEDAIGFDIIISNPPYFKLSKDDPRTMAAIDLVGGQPNIYSLFMGVCAKLLESKGELIFITPRSFASGSYFNKFRNHFFSSVKVERIHLFNSRREAFDRDNVLQETVVLKAVNVSIDTRHDICVTTSHGVRDLSEPESRYFKYSELIDLVSEDKILYLPSSDDDVAVMRLISSWNNVLSDYNISVSTGPVVAFRATEFIKNQNLLPDDSSVPLFWLHNVNKMHLEWPKQFKDKGQYITVSRESKSLLLPNKDYIFLRRFSTKDDNSRLIAAPYFYDSRNGSFIGVENKLNYIYRKQGRLDRDEIIGLCALLNSSLYDRYFQIFNGNVNVSATELRMMKFPPLELIKLIGNVIGSSGDYRISSVNRVVSDSLQLEFK